MKRSLKIATVDDLPSVRAYLADKLALYLGSRGLKYTLFPFKSGEAFIAALDKEQFDIVFMDIYMEGMTGIEAAGKLRERDMDCRLVFLTTSKDFLQQGYAFNPCHYLLKPASGADFDQAMENCRIPRQVEVPFLSVVSNGLALQIDTAKLLYVDICGRNTTLHLTDRTLAVAGSMIKVTEPLLADRRFLICIQGVLVNMDYIAAVEESVFVLHNSHRLQIALRNKNSIIKQYRAYQFESAASGRNFQ